MFSPFPVIFGPTASGKSALALALAAALERRGRRAEIVTADAFQVYRGMDIGTAKPTPAERAARAHHLIDIVSPHASEAFTVEHWLGRAGAIIDSLREAGAVPVVVGGTSLYIQSLLYGLFRGPAGDEGLRAELRAMSPEARRAELLRVDPEAAARIHPTDERRSVRALEVFRLTGTPISRLQRQWGGAGGDGQAPRADARLFILDWPVPALNQRINARVRAMRAAGLAEEVRSLLATGPLNLQAREALGYKQLIPVVSAPGGPPAAREAALDDAFEQIKVLTRRLGKAQRTWARRLASARGAVTLPGEQSEGDGQAQTIANRLCS